MVIAGPVGALSDAQHFQLLVDAFGNVSICLLNPDGFVVSWHAGAEDASGYRADDITGQHFSRFFLPQDRAGGLPAGILREARAGGRCEGEGLRVRKDGTRFRAAVVVETIHDQAGRLLGYSHVMRDISERQEAQEALRASERQFRLLVESVIDYALYMLDPSGIVISWNPGAERLKGYRAEEIIGQHFSRFYSREDRAAGLPMRALETAARDGRCETERWRIRKDGSRFWALAAIDAIRGDNGELLGFAKITRDITERQIAQETLRQSERQFRLLVEGVQDYAIFLLDPNGIVTNWNPGAERIHGYTGDDIIGQHFSRFYSESERSAGVPARVLHAASQEGRFEAEATRVRKDGSVFWAHVVINALRDEAGTLVGFAKITRDISERRATQMALQHAQAQRNYAQKMEALGQLTGGVAHDFNNLLMIIGGHVTTLKRLLADDAKGARAAAAIETAARRGESLTRQLLSFARRQTLNPVVAGIRERIEAVAAMIAAPLGAASKLVTNVQPDTWPVKIDIAEFELALVNIAINSRDAMPQGGIITINAENVQLRPDDTPAGLEGEFVALTIADSGVGIAADILPKVFDPFFTTKRGANGTGLGLSQVHGFAHQSGGTVTIDSELGEGTRITLYLPRAQAVPEERRADPAGQAATSGTALLVEDNPEVMEVTVGLLEQLGYEVRTADSAEAALAMAEGGKFDLVLSDIVMAGAMDGIALARALRQRAGDLPIVLVTGYSHSAILAEAEFTVLRKPYRLAELSRAVAKAAADARGPAGNLVRLRDVRRARQ